MPYSPENMTHLFTRAQVEAGINFRTPRHVRVGGRLYPIEAGDYGYFSDDETNPEEETLGFHLAHKNGLVTEMLMEGRGIGTNRPSWTMAPPFTWGVQDRHGEQVYRGYDDDRIPMEGPHHLGAAIQDHINLIRQGLKGGSLKVDPEVTETGLFKRAQIRSNPPIITGSHFSYGVGKSGIVLGKHIDDIADTKHGYFDPRKRFQFTEDKNLDI
jgi:hypothetical protein